MENESSGKMVTRRLSFSLFGILSIHLGNLIKYQPSNKSARLKIVFPFSLHHMLKGLVNGVPAFHMLPRFAAPRNCKARRKMEPEMSFASQC